MRFYAKDIALYFPQYQLTEGGNDIRFMVLRDMVVANVFVATLAPDGTGIVQFNYTVPQYRDYKVGRFIFEKERDFLLAKGIKKLVYNEVLNKGHKEFLKRMGFQQETTDGAMRYVKYLVEA
jgi:hypothetical protein